ncbi:hypothetical protein E2C01_034773 [Portunus trituberculatus]|uniref:Uncharacterized protein n=1 Tax=Portunus trituberculatus TaxID=210409 RepID=A0A5B7F6K7_PORTR|nr:hypothetical protein [Portunus trituberculatus]
MAGTLYTPETPLRRTSTTFGSSGLTSPLLPWLPGAVNESASSVGEISVLLAITRSGGGLVFRGGRPVVVFRTGGGQASGGVSHLAPGTNGLN